MALARRLAAALDAEDYAGAEPLIAPDCVYRTGDATHRGPAAILASYRAHGEWAATHLDAVRYESQVRAGEDGEAVCEFVDHVEHAGRAHTYRCEQRLRFDGAGRIVAIEHVELPGEREGLRAFFRAVGLASAPEDPRDPA